MPMPDPKSVSAAVCRERTDGAHHVGTARLGLLFPLAVRPPRRAGGVDRIATRKGAPFASRK